MKIFTLNKAKLCIEETNFFYSLAGSVNKSLNMIFSIGKLSFSFNKIDTGNKSLA